jgi:ADP-ribosylglycohydrolase
VKPNDRLERHLGCLIGLAIGDALGTTLEFTHPGEFTPIDDLIGGGPFHLKPGEWTDDTSMALCLASSLAACNGFDPRDQMDRYLRWANQGYWSVKPYCFDIGGTVSAALRRYERTRDPYSGSTSVDTAGNGSLMRLAPVAMFYAASVEDAIQKSGDSSRTTHAAPQAVDACRFFGGLLAAALNGASKDELLSPGCVPVDGLHPAVAAVVEGAYKAGPPARADGYVVNTLHAALWAFFASQDFRSGGLLAVNLGYDADTTGAVYGQLAGAYFGLNGIPADWRQRIAMRDEIESLARQLAKNH